MPSNGRNPPLVVGLGIVDVRRGRGVAGEVMGGVDAELYAVSLRVSATAQTVIQI